MPAIGEIKPIKEIWPERLATYTDKRSGNQRVGWFACIDCGKERWVSIVGGKPSYQRCMDCANKAKRGIRLKGRPNRAIHKQGYILLYIPEYHRATKTGYVMEHIYIWETVNNRHLPKGWLVHHLNGIKNDNRPDNLVAMKAGEHINYAEPFKKRIRALEAHIKILKKALESSQLIYRLEEN